MTLRDRNPTPKDKNDVQISKTGEVTYYSDYRTSWVTVSSALNVRRSDLATMRADMRALIVAAQETEIQQKQEAEERVRAILGEPR